jgi:GT2 family glycosyltransferase
MRAGALRKLLNSVALQTVYPNEIIIVDASTNVETKKLLSANQHKNVHYFLVDEATRGLTKQRNFGISKVAENSEIVSFLDDDIVLENDYFENVLKTYIEFPEALGVGGIITSEIHWDFVGDNYKAKRCDFFYDGWKRKDPFRFEMRKLVGLDTNAPPGYMPTFSNGRSLSFLPPSGKVYPVEQLMGGVASFRKNVFDKNKFSTYFEGYGLYEDADFSLRISKIGKLYCNTNAKLSHYHDSSGRPNQYNYGKMVLRNGWYVWRIKHPNPNLKSRVKWNLIAFLLTLIRFTNIFTTSKPKEAFTESVGRIVGWFSLIFNKPNSKN